MSAPNPQPPAPAVNLDQKPPKEYFQHVKWNWADTPLPSLQGQMEGIAHSRRDALFSFRVDTKNGTRDATKLENNYSQGSRGSTGWVKILAPFLFIPFILVKHVLT